MSLPCGRPIIKARKPSIRGLPESKDRLHGAYEHSRGEEVGFGEASWARILEQGLALDELVEMKTSIERGAQGESGGDQSPPIEGAPGRAAVPPSSELSDGEEGVAARREGGIPAETGKYSSS